MKIMNPLLVNSKSLCTYEINDETAIGVAPGGVVEESFAVGRPRTWQPGNI